ncbi:MAG: hypothetical protein J6Z09_11155, partial [Lachnospiraceae bacterium]|nr:hypothetical protein [Lachnospiraceae bacterium]
MKKISGYLLSMFLVFVALAVANISVLAFISLKAKGIKDVLSAQEISAKISLSDGEYILPEETKALLDKYSSFAMI